MKEQTEIALSIDDKGNMSGPLAEVVRKSAFTDALIRIASREGLLPSHFGDVKAFHEKFGLLVGAQPRHLTRRKLKERVEFLLEELTEFAGACGLGIAMAQKGGVHQLSVIDLQDVGEGGDQDLTDQADALVDLVYVALGTAVMLGLPWQALWDDVQRANMAKVRGETKRGHKVDVTKPPGWRGPQGGKILDDAGYHRDHYSVDGWDDTKVDEAKCHDDV